MKTLILHGQLYRAHSPSLLEQAGYPVWIGFDGRSWRIHIRGAWAARPFATRNQATALIGQAFNEAREVL